MTARDILLFLIVLLQKERPRKSGNELCVWYSLIGLFIYSPWESVTQRGAQVVVGDGPGRGILLIDVTIEFVCLEEKKR